MPINADCSRDLHLDHLYVITPNEKSFLMDENYSPGINEVDSSDQELRKACEITSLI